MDRLTFEGGRCWCMYAYRILYFKITYTHTAIPPQKWCSARYISLSQKHTWWWWWQDSLCGKHCQSFCVRSRVLGCVITTIREVRKYSLLRPRRQITPTDVEHIRATTCPLRLCELVILHTLNHVTQGRYRTHLQPSQQPGMRPTPQGTSTSCLPVFWSPVNHLSEYSITLFCSSKLTLCENPYLRALSSIEQALF